MTTEQVQTHKTAGVGKKYKLTITADDGRPPIVIDLTGTYAAFEALRACQKAQGS